MTGFEPHPVLKLPTKEEVQRRQWEFGEQATKEWLERVINARREALEKAEQDPLNFGFRSKIWDVCDDLLCDGHEVKLLVPDGAGVLVPGPIIKGAPELLVTGWNRSSKSQYCGYKCMRVLTETQEARGVSFSDSETESRAKQQPIFWHYMPAEIKAAAMASGRAREGAVLNVSYKQKTGFADNTFVLPKMKGARSGSQHWFKNYSQNPESIEGDQFNVAWFDELRDPEWLKTIRFRMGDRAGIILVSFTPIEEKKFGASYNEYQRGARTVLEIDGDLLPIRISRKEAVKRGLKILESGKQESRKETNKNRNDEAQNSKMDRLENAEVAGVLVRDPAGRGSDSRQIQQNRSAGADLHGRTEALGVDSKSDPSGFLRSSFPDSSTLPDEDLVLVGYEKVPRVKIAGPGTDGTQRANIVYFHISDNPFYGFQRYPKPGVPQLSGKDIFRKFFAKATRAVIRARAYAILVTGGGALFKFNSAIHTIPAEQIPKEGTNYQIVDPCPGRNWFSIWMRVVPIGGGLVRRYVYREWPTYGHPGAHIQGHGDIGAWALPGKAPDGEKGPAQNPLYFGLNRYKEEFLRLEGAPIADQRTATRERLDRAAQDAADLGGERLKKPWMNNPLKRNRAVDLDDSRVAPGQEVIAERRMDSRYGNTPKEGKEANTTLIEQMAEIEMEFLPTSGKDIGDGVELIKNALDYDEEVEIGKYSPALARQNVPLLMVADNCPNVIYALSEYTGLDGLHGAMKDVVDVVRYAVTDELEYLGGDVNTWVGGGVAA